MPSSAVSADFSVRLQPKYISTIREFAKKHFGDDVKVWLFGSRADLTKRGGDIDLCIEASIPGDLMPLKSAFWLDLQKKLGEQRIDILVRRAGDEAKPIESIAMKTGVRIL